MTHKILSDSSHDVVKTLIYIYTMESFIFTELNKASRNKDLTKIKYFGPFALALSYIVHCGNENHDNDQINQKLYRGFHIPKAEIAQKFIEDTIINLPGFSSSSCSRNCGLEFAFKDLSAEDDPERWPILLEINFTGNK